MRHEKLDRIAAQHRDNNTQTLRDALKEMEAHLSRRDIVQFMLSQGDANLYDSMIDVYKENMLHAPDLAWYWQIFIEALERAKVRANASR